MTLKALKVPTRVVKAIPMCYSHAYAAIKGLNTLTYKRM